MLGIKFLCDFVHGFGRAVSAAGLIFAIGNSLFAEEFEVFGDDEVVEQAEEEISVAGDEANGEQCADPVEGEEWGESPCKASLWKVDAAYVFATSNWDDGDPGFAARLNVARENGDGFGKRFQVWTFNQDALIQTGWAWWGPFINQVDITASSAYFDVYQRLPVYRGNVALGGGLAGGYMNFKERGVRHDLTFAGAGFDLFADGYYPLAQYTKTEFGVIGRGRLALLGGYWNSSRHYTDVDKGWNEGWVTLVDELAWGFELRRRFGRNQDKYWFVDVSREMQGWGTVWWPYTADRTFQGTAVNFGLVW